MTIVAPRIFGYSGPQGNDLIQLENLISLSRFMSVPAPRCLLDWFDFSLFEGLVRLFL